MVNDLLRKYKSNYSSTSNSFSTGTGETVTPNSVSGLPTGTDVTLTFDRVDSGGTATPTKMERIIGTISGSNFVIKERGADGSTEQAHTSPVVEMVWNAKDLNDMVDWGLVEHNQTGVHKAITSSDITASNITASQVTASNMKTRLTLTACTINASQVTSSAVSVTGAFTGMNLNCSYITASNVSACTLTGPSRFVQATGLYDNGNSGSAITINWLNGDRQKVTLSASTTISWSNATSGQLLTLIMLENGTGGYSITLPTMEWPASTVTTWTTTAGAMNTVSVLYDGTASSYYAQGTANYG